jgi:hypothetical protein
MACQVDAGVMEALATVLLPDSDDPFVGMLVPGTLEFFAGYV